MLRYIGPLVVILAVLALASSACASNTPPSPAKGSTVAFGLESVDASPAVLYVRGRSASAALRCYEDEPCWRWPTMGNGKRGVVTVHGDYRVVGPCAFRRMMRWGLLKYEVTFRGKTYKLLDRLKGDGFARRYGCHVKDWRVH